MRRKPSGGRKYHQGFFKPQNPAKYAGDPKNICYRSSWELRVMSKLDLDPDVVSWASEEQVVPYWDPVTKRGRRYFPDFLVKRRDGSITMLEVKPETETRMPRRGKKSQRRFLEEAATYLTNQAKWESAEKFCRDRGWRFQTISERDLGIKPRR